MKSKKALRNYNREKEGKHGVLRGGWSDRNELEAGTPRRKSQPLLGRKTGNRKKDRRDVAWEQHPRFKIR